MMVATNPARPLCSRAASITGELRCPDPTLEGATGNEDCDETGGAIPAEPDAAAPAGANPTVECAAVLPDSLSRFSRFKSPRNSAAL